MPRRRKKKRVAEEINSSSMADIAFLLLVFFLVATTVVNEKGIWFTLPKKPDKKAQEEEVDIKKRNVLKVILNSNNEILISGEDAQMSEIRQKVSSFVNNNGKNPDLSESPQDAIVSFRTDRGTDAQTYIKTLDAIQGAYNDLSAELLGMTTEQYLKLDRNEKEDFKLIDKAEKAFPRVISETKPSGEK